MDQLEWLIDSINMQLKALKEQGLKLYDGDDINNNYYIKSVKYNKNHDKLEFHCVED